MTINSQQLFWPWGPCEKMIYEHIIQISEICFNIMQKTHCFQHSAQLSCPDVQHYNRIIRNEIRANSFTSDLHHELPNVLWDRSLVALIATIAIYRVGHVDKLRPVVSRLIRQCNWCYRTRLVHVGGPTTCMDFMKCIPINLHMVCICCAFYVVVRGQFCPVTPFTNMD